MSLNICFLAATCVVLILAYSKITVKQDQLSRIRNFKETSNFSTCFCQLYPIYFVRLSVSETVIIRTSV